jgi:hypothetical protein
MLRFRSPRRTCVADRARDVGAATSIDPARTYRRESTAPATPPHGAERQTLFSRTSRVYAGIRYRVLSAGVPPTTGTSVSDEARRRPGSSWLGQRIPSADSQILSECRRGPAAAARSGVARASCPRRSPPRPVLRHVTATSRDGYAHHAPHVDCVTASSMRPAQVAAVPETLIRAAANARPRSPNCSRSS